MHAISTNPDPKTSIPSFEAHARAIRNRVIVSMTDILERSGLSKSCVVIFCSNNFHTIFNDLNMVHVNSLLDRLTWIDFHYCNRDEIIRFIHHYNSKYHELDLYIPTEELDARLSELPPDISISHRKLFQLTTVKCYDFRLVIDALKAGDMLETPTLTKSDSDSFPPISSRSRSPPVSSLTVKVPTDSFDRLSKSSLSPVRSTSCQSSDSSKSDDDHNHNQEQDMIDKKFTVNYITIDIDPNHDFDSNLQGLIDDVETPGYIYECPTCNYISFMQPRRCSHPSCTFEFKVDEEYKPGSNIAHACHDCLCPHNHTVYIAADEESGKKDYTLLLSLFGGQNKKPQLTGRMYTASLFMLVGRRDIAAHMNRYPSLRLVVIRKIIQFWQQNPRLMTANALLFERALRNIIPVDLY